MSKVFNDIVNEFLVKQHLPFEIYIFENISPFPSQVLSQFLIADRESFTYKIHQIANVKEYYNHKGPAIIFCNNPNQLNFFFVNVLATPIDNKPLFYFIYVESLTYLYLYQSIEIFSDRYAIKDLAQSTIIYTFIITNDGSTITLSTVEFFLKRCGRPYLSKVNEYNKDAESWNTALKYYEKFMEYNGCELVMLLPLSALVEGANLFFWGYAHVNEDFSGFKPKNLVPEIFEILAGKFNFKAGYQPIWINSNFILSQQEKDIRYRIHINGTFREPSVFFYVHSLEHKFRSSYVFMNVKFLIYTTPADAYTPYEKLLLPFDSETWILLAATFFITFLSIIVINRLSRKIQNLVYGKQIETPIWNVISIFFGVSQTKLPTENFSRFILTLFIVFCLIFRTCFQSKSFEFLTSEPRRIPPKTIQDLIDRNFSFALEDSKTYLSDGSAIDTMIKNEYGKWPRVELYRPDNYKNLIFEQSQNSSAKLSLIIDDFTERNFTRVNSGVNNWNKFVMPFFVDYISFASKQAAFHFRMMEKVVNRLIETGVMNILVERHILKPIKSINIPLDPKVLSVDDLMFGFNIWLGFCVISGVVFIIEIILRIRFIIKRLISKNSKKRKLTSRKLKFAKVGPMLENDCLKVVQNMRTKKTTLQEFRIKKKVVEIEEISGEIMADGRVEAALIEL